MKPAQTTSCAPDPGASDPEEASVDLARRRVLQAGKYVAPAVIGVIVLQNAGCQPGPSCVPDGAACVPDTGPPCVPNR